MSAKTRVKFMGLVPDESIDEEVAAIEKENPLQIASLPATV